MSLKLDDSLSPVEFMICFWVKKKTFICFYFIRVVGFGGWWLSQRCFYSFWHNLRLVEWLHCWQLVSLWTRKTERQKKRQKEKKSLTLVTEYIWYLQYRGLWSVDTWAQRVQMTDCITLQGQFSHLQHLSNFTTLALSLLENVIVKLNSNAKTYSTGINFICRADSTWMT